MGRGRGRGEASWGRLPQSLQPGGVPGRRSIHHQRASSWAGMLRVPENLGAILSEAGPELRPGSPKPWKPTKFPSKPSDILEEGKQVPEDGYPSLGLGENVRIQGESISGAALIHEGRVLHLSVFRQQWKENNRTRVPIMRFCQRSDRMIIINGPAAYLQRIRHLEIYNQVNPSFCMGLAPYFISIDNYNQIC